MKKLLVFFLLLGAIAMADLKPADLAEISSDTIHIHVEGACTSDDLQVPMYTTAGEVMEMIDLEENADITALNPDTVLKDHDVLVIPEARPEQPRISINSADADLLSKLPGIGPATAEKIILYREENGLFQQLEDLMKVSGIGENKFAKIRDLICL